jgi:hypothetical protein
MVVYWGDTMFMLSPVVVAVAGLLVLGVVMAIGCLVWWLTGRPRDG